MSVGAVSERSERPAYVRFKTVTVEDKEASLRDGHWTGRDIHYALITPPYSRDIIEIKVSQWKLNMAQDVRNVRMPDEWQQNYLRQYDAWTKGLEVPLSGVPIKGWGVISPAQQEMLIRLGILTVEDMAQVNSEGLQRIGMGAVEIKNKAAAWLAQLNDKGALTIRTAALETENSNLKSQLTTLAEQFEQLKRAIPQARNEGMTPADEAFTRSITADDIMPEAESISKPKKK